MNTVVWSEIEVNRVWLRGVANVLEELGRFSLAPHDVIRLREIAEQLPRTFPTVIPDSVAEAVEIRAEVT